ncbi:unnamed protein product [Enterobius vermicularis]|uniref:Uncharacterized protein n=1 Tax=Enterobius vermicularis TaxID=51028 RepID=A0A0N4VHP7_ENTVE|nr:unnamed protein product [Enterobius vermicularis]
MQVLNALDQPITANKSWLKIIISAKDGKKHEEEAAYTQMSAMQPSLLTDLDAGSEALIDIQCAKSAQAVLDSVSLRAQNKDAALQLQNVTSTKPSFQQATTSSDRANDKQGNDQVAAPFDSEQSVIVFPRAQLPQFKILKFTRRLRDWPTFWNTYEQMVHLNRRIPTVLKFNYLMELLTKEAKAFILDNVSRPENYSVLVQKVKEVCADDRCLRAELQLELRFFQPIAQKTQFPNCN